MSKECRVHYLIQCVAGSYKSRELHRLEERLWDSPAALLHHPRRSGGLSHTSPSICIKKKIKKLKQAMSQDLLGVNFTVKFVLGPSFRHFSYYAHTFSCERRSLSVDAVLRLCDRVQTLKLATGGLGAL